MLTSFRTRLWWLTGARREERVEVSEQVSWRVRSVGVRGRQPPTTSPSADALILVEGDPPKMGGAGGCWERLRGLIRAIPFITDLRGGVGWAIRFAMDGGNP
jgi:hypothetical protein